MGEDLESLRARARELLIEAVRAAAERRGVAARIASEKARLGLPLEDLEREAELWSAAVEEAGAAGMDEKAAGRLTWHLVRDALLAEGLVERGRRLAAAPWTADLVRLDTEWWTPLAQPRPEEVVDLPSAEARLASKLGVKPSDLVAFSSWREAVRAALELVAEGRGVFLQEPVHPWLTSAVWGSGGRPYALHRELESCWRLREPSAARRGWVLVVEDPEYNTGIAHGEAELEAMASFAESSGMALLHLGPCAQLAGRAGPPAPLLERGAVSIGSSGCAYGSLDSGVAWVISRQLAGPLRDIRDSRGLAPRPADVAAAASMEPDGLRAEVARRVEYASSLLEEAGVRLCRPSSGPHLFAASERFSTSASLAMGVAVAPGSAFGDYGRAFRLNFLVEEDSLGLGLGLLILSLVPRWPA